MSDYHPACAECVQNGKCLLQDDGDVDECVDVQEYEQSMESEKEGKK